MTTLLDHQGSRGIYEDAAELERLQAAVANMVNVQQTLRDFPLDPRRAPSSRVLEGLSHAESTFFLTVRELADRLADGSITSVELTEAYLDRAESWTCLPSSCPASHATTTAASSPPWSPSRATTPSRPLSARTRSWLRATAAASCTGFPTA